MSLKRILFVPDCHIPYHDENAFSLMLRAGANFKPNIIVVLGDFVDFYAVSSHSKNPDRSRNLAWEVDKARECRARLDNISLGATRKIFIAGNHEDRLHRYLCDRAPELFGVISIPNLLQLKENGWEYVPYKHSIKLGKLYLTHDTGNAGNQAHLRAQADFQANAIIGHTHRLGYAVVGDAKGDAHVAAMFGWLGDFDQIDYAHRIKIRRDWAHGFGIGYMEPSGVVYTQPIPIVRKRCLINGRVIQ